MKSTMLAMLVLGALPALAQARNERQDLRQDYRQADRLRADLANDQVRLNQTLRFGRYREADAIRRDMARDQRKLRDLNRDIRHDRRDLRYDRGYR